MSTYITKDHANFIASQMVKKMSAEIQSHQEALSQFVTDRYNETIPADILDAYKKYPNYFKRASRILLRDNGLNDSFGLFKPVCALSDFQAVFQPDTPAAKVISKHLNQIDKLKTKRDSLKKQIEQTLLSLRTYKRIEDKFPEAFALIPQRSTVNAVAIPIDDIRKQLGAIK